MQEVHAFLIKQCTRGSATHVALLTLTKQGCQHCYEHSAQQMLAWSPRLALWWHPHSTVLRAVDWISQGAIPAIALCSCKPFQSTERCVLSSLLPLLKLLKVLIPHGNPFHSLRQPEAKFWFAPFPCHPKCWSVLRTVLGRSSLLHSDVVAGSPTSLPGASAQDLTRFRIIPSSSCINGLLTS